MSNTRESSEVTQWRRLAAGAEPAVPVTQEVQLVRLLPAAVAPSQEVAPSHRRFAPFFYSLVPALFAAIYLFFIAADIYNSEARFMVRTASASTLSALVQSRGMTRAPDDAYAVVAFAQSRDLVEALAKEDNLRAFYARPEADFLTRYPHFLLADTIDHLRDHFMSWTDVRIEETTGIVTLRAYAFRPQDAQTLAGGILRRAEAFVNEMNRRALSDRVGSAQSLEQVAKERVADVERRLTAFRNENKFVDPGRESAAALEMIGKMTTEIVQLEATLKQHVQVTPQNPAIPSLRGKIANYREQLDKLRREVVGDPLSMSTKLAAYERLVLERKLAARELEVAHMNYLAAAQDAQQQQVYLEMIANPTAPDRPDFPRRGLWLAICMAASIGVFIVVSALASIARAHVR